MVTVNDRGAKISTLEQLRSDGRVAVLLGGRSAEREVSLDSGAAVVDSLQAAGFEVQAIDTGAGAAGYWQQLQEYRPDFCFIALHGGEGENGSWQGALELLDIPYSGSGVMASALALDKRRSKQVWQALGLPTPNFRSVLAGEAVACEELLEALGGRVFVKPVTEGSSQGMSMAGTAEELRSAISRAAGFCNEILVEQFVDGPEYTVAILQGQSLPSISISTQRDFYDYQAKYRDDDTVFDVPSGLDTSTEQQLQQLAHEAFDALGCEHWGRVDFMRERSSGQFYLLEANTVPGLTSHSLVPMAAEAAGKSFTDLLLDIIALGLKR